MAMELVARPIDFIITFKMKRNRIVQTIKL
jgi:hypothetical protein